MKTSKDFHTSCIFMVFILFVEQEWLDLTPSPIEKT